jgi:hypothetical protein
MLVVGPMEIICHAQFDEPAVSHVPAGNQGPVQEDDVTDGQMFDIFIVDWRR